MSWHHVGIEVGSLEDSIQFYENMFEMKIEQRFTLNGEEIVFLTNDDVKIELIESKDISALSNSVHLAWKVDDIESWMKGLREKGLFPSEGPYKLKNGWIVVFYEGLDGEVIELVEVCGN